MKVQSLPTAVSFWMLLGMLLFASACEKAPFNEEAPYAVMVGKHRSWQLAENFRDALKNKGLPVYIRTLQVPGSGKWFGLFLGSSAVLEEMMALKIDYEDKYGLHHLEIVNFNQIQDQLISAEPHLVEKIENQLSQWPAPLTQITALLPYRPSFQVEHFSYFHPLQSASFTSFPELRKTMADLPRGISTEQLLKVSNGFAEAIYHDPLHDLTFTVELALLKKESVPADSLILQYAKEILNTRYYEVEELHDTEVETQKGYWSGYMVSITPKKNKVKRYLLLASPQKDKVLFVQASSESANQMLFFSEQIGQEASILHYENVHNSLYLLAPQLSGNERLAHLQLDILGGLKGQNSKFLEGHTRTIYRYHHPDDGLWEARFTFMNEPEQSRKLFDRIFARNTSAKDSVSLKGSQGFIAYERKYSPARKKRIKIAGEVQLYSARYLGYISNSGQSELDKADLLRKADCFQLNAPIEPPGFFSGL